MRFSSGSYQSHSCNCTVSLYRLAYDFKTVMRHLIFLKDPIFLLGLSAGHHLVFSSDLLDKLDQAQISTYHSYPPWTGEVTGSSLEVSRWVWRTHACVSVCPEAQDSARKLCALEDTDMLGKQKTPVIQIRCEKWYVISQN